ncbi:MAG: fibronectin type III domain-containing protein, partial [Thaumarchaeota archaeon]|nr:fibronectin type III domain-containing protein [Nitrososphaerota archaeon]
MMGKFHFVLFTIVILAIVLALSTSSIPVHAQTASSIVLGSTQSTSGTVSSSPYQLTISNFNVGTGTDRLLVVGVSANNANAVSVTFGTSQLSQAVSSFQNNDAEFWYLVNPTGTGNIVVTLSGSASAVVGAYSFSGVNQASPIAGTAANYNPAGTPSSPTVSIATKYKNDLVADLPSIYGGQLLRSPTCAQQWNANVPSKITGASSTTTVSSPGTVTCGWTANNGGDQWDDVAIEVRASGTPSISESAPSAPTGLTANPGNATVSLSWSAPSSDGGSAITGYNIYRGTASGGETKYSSVSSSQTAYNDTSVTNGIKYYYEVTAVNAVGESARSGEASATPQTGATAPSAPTSLTGTPGNGTVSLSWTAPSSNGGSAITGYNVYRGTASGGEGSTPVKTGITSTSYTDTGLTNGVTYYYTVKAVNSVGTSPASNEVGATPTVPSTAPGSPTGLVAAGGNAQISLSWSAPSSDGGSAITGYNVYRGTASGGETKYSSVSSSQTAYNDTSVTNGIKYYYEVTAVNAVGESARSGEASATPSATTYSISKISSGLFVSDSFTNETETQQQLQSSSGYWTFGGSAPADKANYTLWRDTTGLHIGVQAPSNGTYAGYYALSKSTDAMLFHSVLAAPSQNLPATNVYYNNGLYVVSSTPGDSNYVTCASDTSSYGTVWALFFVTPTQYDRLWYDTSANQPLTRDCTIVTNGTNYLKLYMDGVPVYESNSLSLGMPSPFATYLEVQTSYNGSMLNSTYTDYYATASENVTLTNLPSSAATVSITNSSGSVLASSQVSGGNSILAIGKYHLPLAGTVNVYDSSNSLITSASEDMYGGDVYSVNFNGQATAPSAPTSLTGTPGNGTVSLSWTAP